MLGRVACSAVIDEDFASLKHVRLVHLTLTMLLQYFLLELGELLLDSRVNVACLFKRTTSQRYLIPIRKNAAINYVWVHATVRL